VLQGNKVGENEPRVDASFRSKRGLGEPVEIGGGVCTEGKQERGIKEGPLARGGVGGRTSLPVD